MNGCKRTAVLLGLSAGLALGPVHAAEPPAADERALVARLAASEKTGQLDDLEIEHYRGGGLPSPFSRSDQLRLLVLDGQPTVVNNVPPPQSKLPRARRAQYRMPLTAERLRRVAQLFREAGVFSRHFEEEKDPAIGDVTTTEITLMSGDRKKQVMRRYYQRVPAGLAALEAEMQALREEVRRGAAAFFDEKGSLVP